MISSQVRLEEHLQRFRAQLQRQEDCIRTEEQDFVDWCFPTRKMGPSQFSDDYVQLLYQLRTYQYFNKLNRLFPMDLSEKIDTVDVIFDVNKNEGFLIISLLFLQIALSFD